MRPEMSGSAATPTDQRRNLYVIFGSLMAGLFLSELDQTIIADLIPARRRAHYSVPWEPSSRRRRCWVRRSVAGWPPVWGGAGRSGSTFPLVAWRLLWLRSFSSCPRRAGGRFSWISGVSAGLALSTIASA